MRAYQSAQKAGVHGSITIRDNRQNVYTLEQDARWAEAQQKEAQAHRLQTLALEVKDRAAKSMTADGSRRPILLLPVMIEGGPEAETVEQRMRVRVAVLSGLARAEYVPASPDHLRFVVASMTAPGTDGSSGVGEGGGTALPFEWCDPPDILTTSAVAPPHLPRARRRVRLIFQPPHLRPASLRR